MAYLRNNIASGVLETNGTGDVARNQIMQALLAMAKCLGFISSMIERKLTGRFLVGELHDLIHVLKVFIWLLWENLSVRGWKYKPEEKFRGQFSSLEWRDGGLDGSSSVKWVD